MKKLKSAWRFLSSMRFAMALLFIIVISCAAGSVIPQGKTLSWYTSAYSERAAAAIVALRLDDVFHSPWFVAITVFLIVNLTMCNIVRLPSLIKRFRSFGTHEYTAGAAADAAAEGVSDPGEVFRRMGFDPSAGASGGIISKGRGKWGIFGAWICHLGIILIIAGFGLGQMYKKEYSVYGVPGQTKEIGDTGYLLSIDDYNIEFGDGDSVRQYTTELTVGSPDGELESARVAVNAPAELFGMKLFQNSTGWAADIRVQKDGEELQRETLCVGEHLPVKDKPELVVYFNAFYPDYVLDKARGPMTASSELKNPAYLYSVYYEGQMLGMNALMEGEELTIDEYTVTFEEPSSFTLIQIKRDPFTPLALIGGLVTVLGLILAFYVFPAWMRAERRDDGSWNISAGCRKGGPLFKERFDDAIAACGGRGTKD